MSVLFNPIRAGAPTLKWSPYKEKASGALPILHNHLLAASHGQRWMLWQKIVPFESAMNIFTICELLWFLWDIPAKYCCTVFMLQSIFGYSHLHCIHLAGRIFHIFVQILEIFQVMSDLANYLGVCVSLTSACLSMVVSSSLTDFLWFQFWKKRFADAFSPTTTPFSRRRGPS